MSDMILTTTPYIEGRKVQDYLGIVSGETISTSATCFIASVMMPALACAGCVMQLTFTSPDYIIPTK